jgi:phosphatidylglycerophosphatase A
MAPKAPGTVGSLGALPLHFLLRRLSPGVYALTTLGLFVVGVWSAQKESERLDRPDPQSVVIDEVVGALIAMGLAGGGVGTALGALALFRVFDIAKPGIIDDVQHVEPEGMGIMLDDVLAGLAAGVLARVLLRR